MLSVFESWEENRIKMLPLQCWRFDRLGDLNGKNGTGASAGSATDEDLECGENLFEFTVIQSNALQ